ncbi:MAG: four helix bundle protein [Candidatus Peribacteraceae bacterium]|nr:four helix bundle protein [Candidatus Peribacteraceae bacterium]
MIRSHRDLIVWQKAMDLVDGVYSYTEHFPRSEQYGLTKQMRNAAVSIPSNIAEGRRRGTRADYRHFLLISFGSGAELETQLEIARRRKYGDDMLASKIEVLLTEVMSMLNVMIQKLESPARMQRS